MIMKISKIICLFAVLSVISAVYAQDKRRQWAIDTNIGFTFFNIKQNPIDHLSSKHGKVTYLGAEYYIPDTHFSLRLGYQNEKIKIIRDMVAPIQESVSAGGRWYPAPYEWRIQPYLGANTNVYFSGNQNSKWWNQNKGITTEYNCSVKAPVISLAPSVGIDLYIFSSIALYINYSYNIGVGSKYDINYSRNNQEPTRITGNINHQNLQLGIKINFPFIWSEEDSEGLGEALMDILFGIDHY